MTTRPFGKLLSKLSVRLTGMLAIALVPIGILGVIQTDALRDEAKARMDSGLMGATLQAAQEEMTVIHRAQGMVAAIAQTIPLVIDDPAACSALMQSIFSAEENASFVGFVPADGQLICSSSGRRVDMTKSPVFERIRDSEAPTFAVNANAPISGTSVLAVTHPVRDSMGDYIGYASISLPHSRLRALQPDAGTLDAPASQLLTFWTFDAAGTVLTSSQDIDAAAPNLPANIPLSQLVGHPGGVFETVAQSGAQRTYAAVPIVSGEFYLLSSWQIRSASIFGQTQMGILLPTLLMWAAGVVMAGLAAERLVLRHVRSLSRAITGFAKGNRRLISIDLDSAPAELRALGTAYTAMTENITYGEARLEDSLHQKEVLLREVHHRVKNNLQLIASIINIQIRKADSPETKRLLKGLQDRVMGLATIHRQLYETSGMADVQVKELFGDIIRQITLLAAVGERPVTVKTDIDDMRLVPDQVVPLALLATEALTNAIKHGQNSPMATSNVTIRLKRVGGTEAMLEISNLLHDDKAPLAAEGGPETGGIGQQLIRAFSQQLGARIEQLDGGGRHTLRVIFVVTPLSATAPIPD